MRSSSSGSIEGRPVTVAVFQSLAHKPEADVLLDQPQQMVLRNLIFQTEVVEQRFRTGMVPHHDEQASENGNPERHVQLPCNMLPPYLCLLIAVTFSTPTGDFTT